MKKISLSFFGIFLFSISAFAQNTATVRGTVFNSKSMEALFGVNVVLEGTLKGASTNLDGAFEIKGIPAGTYTIKASYLGFEEYRKEGVVLEAGQSFQIEISLIPTTFMGDELVVSGSRRPEKLLDAPLSIEAISAEDLKTTGGETFMSALSELKGVDYVNAGINTQLVSARGFNSNFNTRMLFMMDGRIATLGATGLPQGNFLPQSKIDLKNMEVVLGPASALYGPNAHAGVVNVTTKDPWDQSGVTVSTRVGNQDLRDINYRVAGTVNEKFGWKITGQYMRALDFKPDRKDSLHFYSSVGTKPTAANTIFETDVVGEYEVGSTKVNASLYYLLDDWKISGSYGWAQIDQFSLTGNGRNHIHGWEVDYQTLQASNQNWYAQFTRTGNKAGSYQLNQVVPLMQAAYDNSTPLGNFDLQALKDAVSFIDDTNIYDSELQYRNKFFGVDIAAGFQYRYFDPDSKGSYLADANGEDIHRELIGGYIQLDYKMLENKLRLVGAARVDGNNDYETQFSPKASIVYTVAPGHNIRFSYNKAFTTPTILQSHAYIPIDLSVYVPGYGVLIAGNTDGYTIKNNSDGSVANYIPAVDPESVNSIELGYKSAINQKLFIDIVGYYSWYKDFIGGGYVADGFTTTAYDKNDNAVQMDGFPFTSLSTFYNFGEAEVKGLDIGLNYYFSENYIFSANTSMIKLESWKNSITTTVLPLNVPPLKFKGSFTAKNFISNKTIREPYVKLSGRWQDAYQFINSYWSTDVLLDNDGDFTNKEELPDKFVADFSCGFDLSDSGMAVQASVSNIFDTKRMDVLGTPPMGRLIWVSVTYNFNGLRL